MGIPQNKQSHATLLPATQAVGYPFEDGIFGLNMEITRKGFFGGLCAQMLNNRKLYMGQDGVDGWECQSFERVLDRPEESLCRSNFIVLKNGSMSQTSQVIALQKGRAYEAKVWVKAYSDTAAVTFGITGLEQTVTVMADNEPYRALFFVFDGQDLDNGTFTVKVSGEVAVYEVSLMPTDHFYGMRWDVIEQLRIIAPTSLRFPGGCAADHFAWRESLKAPEFRKPVEGLSKAWFLFRDTYHQDTMDIGLNEFFMLCKELNAEPEYTVSLILSDGQDARDLIEYCNGSADTEYGAIRQSLGYDAFNIRTWYVGNEVYYFGAQYQRDGVGAAKRTSEIVNAMRTVDADIAVILGFVADQDLQKWSFDYLENLTCTYELISYHRYNGSAPNAEPDGKTACDNLESSFKDDTDAGLEFYKNQLFKDNFDTTRICVDEWNFCWGSGSNNALLFSNAIEFHFFARTAEKYHIREARFFMPVNEGMITVMGTESKIESSGELIRLMAGHRGGTVIGCASDAKDLDILCTRHDGYLYVSAVNRGATPYCLSMEGYNLSDCTEIRVNDFNFFSNDYEIVTGNDATVAGHSVLFVKLAPNT